MAKKRKSRKQAGKAKAAAKQQSRQDKKNGVVKPGKRGKR